MKIHLHVGAHKTGTTFTQSCLASNRATLNASGIGYLPLSQQRAFHDALREIRPDRFDFASFAASFFATPPSSDPVGIIMSDENLLGSCYSLVSRGEFYPHAAKRLLGLRPLLRGHDTTLFFSIRSYDTFLASAFCEVLRNRGQYVPFSEFRSRLDLETCRWPGLFAQVVQAIEPDHVVVWRFEDFPANAETVVRRLAFGFDGPLPPDAAGGAERPSMSQAAFDVLAAIAERHGPELAGLLVKSVDKGLPKGAVYPGFHPWQEAETAALRAMYREDCLSFPAPIWELPGGNLPPSLKQR